ncbi:MAG: hypothetical protein A2Z99_01040 [Treponema sp. GWB1_62_6]|nr:MAG: hypothetical protein A2Y36_16065 [Treponema sp. GWA1_62_8]OHE66033.1 MAG: hypothetical protein A2Z99_01040 [Treponema sp. GWB1_62_6]OHE68171.1 MAG: hypothetical protein A2001_12425 [Treponema sp. GWC1_61_84]HCM28347.1 hypothetical protein [Treponema sp.]
MALVIGHVAYQHIPRLNNPVNDAVEMSGALRELGFAVTRVTDADLRTLRTVLDDFGQTMRGSETAIFSTPATGLPSTGRTTWFR